MKKVFIALLSLMMLAFVLTACDITADDSGVSIYTRVDEDTILFGEYPQTKVTDATLVSALNNMAGTLPTSSNSQNWTSYGYYVSGAVIDYMWYIDIESGEDKYRGVYFTSYRPRHTDYSSSSSNTYQDDNGYNTSMVYWFKYEPISWTVVNEDDGTAFIVCDMIIDSQEFDNENGSSDNDYAESTIRRWLNDTFYNTAFNQYEQKRILTTAVDNSVESTGYEPNPYLGSWRRDTKDKVFLLSYVEVVDYCGSRQDRIKQATDYAQSQGAYTIFTRILGNPLQPSSTYMSIGDWWLRSPCNDTFYESLFVSVQGYIYTNGGVKVNNTSSGVVPALWIQL